MRPLHVLVILLLAAAVVSMVRPAQAQMLVLTEDLWVTEVRHDKNKIGTTNKKGTPTRSWVDVEGKTRVFRKVGGKQVPVSQGEMWRTLKKGARIRVHGGGDWDMHIVAKKIWY